MTPGPVGAPGARRDAVIVLSWETIDDIVRRGFARPPDRLIQSFAEDPAIDRLVVVGPLRSAPIRAARMLAGQRQLSGPAHLEYVGVQPLRIRRRDPVTTTGLERTYRHYERTIASTVERNGLRSPLVVSFNCLHAGFAPRGWEGSFVYYARDDWASHPSYRRWWPAFEEAYQRMRDRSTAVAAVSEVLLRRVDPGGAGLVVPNGVDVAEWAEPPPAPSWFRDLPHPRMLYLGTLDERLDLEALRRVAEAVPDGSIVLAGPTPPGSPVPTLALDNVHRVGSQERGDVVAMTCESDVCLLLHRRTPLTEAMSPLKLYEYLAGGCPVVATDLAPVRGISERVVLVADPCHVVESVERALELGRARESARMRFVRDNSWQERHRRLLEFGREHGRA